MADFQQIYNSVNYKYKDLGDGSYAQVMALDGGVTISNVTVSDVEISNDSGSPIPIAMVTRSCTGHEVLSVGTSTPITLTPPAGSVSAAIQADGNAVSIRLDGGTPTTTSGIRLDDGQTWYVDTSLASVRLLARTATTTVQVVYFNKA